MSIKCSLGLHSWDGCKCSKCGQIRDEQHLWDGCKCSKCGQIRDEQHIVGDLTCKNCGKPLDHGNFTDNRDGHVYKWVRIGDQIWMAENLNVSHYRNGDPIPQVKDKKEWELLTTSAWCYYKNHMEKGETYGKLYNCYAANDPRGLAPDGWHIPTDDEWAILMDFLGYSVAGGKLKVAGTTLWASPNKGATNESGFTALPGGYRYSLGEFEGVWDEGRWWSATQSGTNSAWFRYMNYNCDYSSRSFCDMRYGFSVRCVRD